MKTIRFVMFLFYRYYRSGRWESAPYFHTLTSMSMLAFLNISSILCFSGLGHLIFPGSKEPFYIRVILFFVLSLFCFYMLGKEKQLKALDYDETTIRRGNWLLILYAFLSMGLLILSIIYGP
jgi:hypothetical protein